VLQDILKVLKLIFRKQRLRAALITLTPAHPNEFIDSHNANVRIAVLPITELNTRWNSILELLEQAYQSQDFTLKWLQTPK